MALPTRPLKDFLSMVLPEVPYCPRPVAEQYLRLAAIEFCERTRCWRHVTTQDITAQDGAIVAPDYATIHEIETAEWGEGVELMPTQFSEIDADAYGAEAGAAGPPRYITQVAANQIAVVPFDTGSLRLSLFLKPRSGSEFGGDPNDPLQDKYNVVPEFMFIQHGDHIASGALARIMNLPDQTYTNPKMAAQHLARFERACDTKFSSNMRGQHRAKRRAKAHPF